MLDNKIDEKKAQEIEKIYIQHLYKRRVIMKITQSEVEVVFSDSSKKGSFPSEQTIKLKKFSIKMM